MFQYTVIRVIFHSCWLLIRIFSEEEGNYSDDDDFEKNDDVSTYECEFLIFNSVMPGKCHNFKWVFLKHVLVVDQVMSSFCKLILK